MRSLQAIVRHRRELVDLCARQRRECVSACAPLVLRLGLVDSALGLARRAVRSPLFWAISAGVAATSAPRRLIPLLRRAVLLWQGFITVRRTASALLRAAHLR